MYIVMLSDSESSGGAAIATSRLATGLCQMGHRVTRIVARRDGLEHPWQTITSPFFELGRAAHRLGLNKSWGRVSRWIGGRVLSALLKPLKPDVINVHNLHGAYDSGLSPEILRVCAYHAPTVWTLHDMWSFTGRCAVWSDCEKFVTGCDSSCPTPTEYPDLAPSRIAAAWQARRRVFRDIPSLAAVSPSRWLAQEACRGLWMSHLVTVIPNGLDLAEYIPLQRKMAREALGIESRGTILLASAESLVARHKGMSQLLEALRQITHPELTLVTLGRQAPEVQVQSVRLQHLGYIDHERTKVLAYSAADALVHPALADNLPNVVVESIACGTPVIAFPTGGLPEMVRPGQTGWLAEAISPSALAAAIEQAIQDLRAGTDLRSTCRAVAENEFGLGLQASRYSALFERLLAREKSER